MLRLKNLSYHYKNKAALRDINLEMTEPGIVGIFGHNGSGKSTLLKILCGLLPVDKGEVEFFKKPALDGQRRVKASLREHIGTLLQCTSSDSMLTVRDNLLFFAKMMAIETKNHSDLIKDTLRHANLIHEHNHRVKTLSYGTRRRMELYRTFMHKPKLVFLDEATAGLDTSECSRFLSYLRDYQVKEQALILMATHNPYELELCDQVLMLLEGSILLEEKPEQLFKDLNHWHYDVKLDQKGEVRSLSFIRPDLSEVYENKRMHNEKHT